MNRRNFIKMALAPGAVLAGSRPNEIEALYQMIRATSPNDAHRKAAIISRLQELAG